MFVATSVTTSEAVHILMKQMTIKRSFIDLIVPQLAEGSTTYGC